MKNYFLNSNSSFKNYHKAPLVVIYTKGLSQTFMENCLNSLNIEHKAIDTKNRVINGKLDFGYCEKSNKKCNYLFLVQHPIDSILQNYLQCLTNSSHESCLLNNVDISKMSLKTYARSESSNIFNNIHYYLDKCHLNTDNCLFPNTFAERLTDNELKDKLLESIRIIDKMFGAVGIYQNVSESMKMFEYTSGKNFRNCSIEMSKYRLTEKEINSMRQSLINDGVVSKRIYPDLILYQKLHNVFKEELGNLYSIKNKSIKDKNNENKS